MLSTYKNGDQQTICGYTVKPVNNGTTWGHFFPLLTDSTVFANHRLSSNSSSVSAEMLIEIEEETY